VAAFRWALREVDHGLEQLRRQLQTIRDGDSFVKAGVVGEKASADHGGITDGDLAMVHEFGATIERGGETITIPERSFIRSSFDTGRAAYVEQLRRRIQDVYDGKGTIAQALAALGEAMSTDMRKRIDSGELPPIKPETAARKGSDQPLVDTGRLRDSIAQEVILSGDKS
jgi:phage gpG-like protein